MEEPTTFSASDLIHIYLDGEATGLQQSMLFGRLAGSSELQAEFTEALQIRAAIEHERIHTMVPANVTQSLFEKAGFTAPGPEVIATAGRAGPFRGFLGRLGVPVLSAVGSALLTLLLLTQSNRKQYDELNAALRQVRAERLLDSIRFAAARNEFSTQGEQVSSAQGTSREIARGQSASAERAMNASSDGENQRSASSRNSAHDGNSTHIQDVLPPAADARNILNTMQSAENTRNNYATRSITETSLRTKMPVSPEQGMSRDDIHISGGTLPATDVIPAFAENAGQMHRFSVQLREITDLRRFPDQGLEGQSQPSHSNVSAGILYQLSEHHALGLEGGREYLPLYRSDRENFTLKPYLAWVGGTYRFRPGALDDAGLFQPFAQASLGGSLSGPIGRGMMGISYTPGGHIDFSLGIEGTSLMYQLRDSWYATGKMGVTYMMNVHF